MLKKQFTVQSHRIEVTIDRANRLPRHVTVRQAGGDFRPQRCIANRQQRPRPQRAGKVFREGETRRGIPRVVMFHLQTTVRQIVRQEIAETIRCFGVHQQADFQFEIEELAVGNRLRMRGDAALFQKAKRRLVHGFAAMFRIRERISPATRAPMGQRDVEFVPGNEARFRFTRRFVRKRVLPHGVRIQGSRIRGDAGIGGIENPEPFARGQATVTGAWNGRHAGKKDELYLPTAWAAGKGKFARLRFSAVGQTA